MKKRKRNKENEKCFRYWRQAIWSIKVWRSVKKYNLWKPWHYNLCITSWVLRFINNVTKTKVKGPLTIEELINQQKFWTKRKQLCYRNDDKFKSDTEHLKHRKYLQMSRKNAESLSCLSIIEIFTEWEINLPRPSKDYSLGS